ncbi:MAG: WYL domain-containing protein [Clostridia bacterium]
MESKKLFILRILQILEKYSDENHPLTQNQIIKFMEKDFDTICERKAIGRNISYLKEAGYDIENVGHNGVYLLSRKFESSELSLLIDSVLASKHIDKKHSGDLINKLIDEGGKYFVNTTNCIYYNKQWQKTDNKTVFYNIEILNEAISEEKQVYFIYNQYDINKKLVPKREKEYLVNPYKLLIHNQHYYLISNNDNHSNISYYRIDKITNIKKLNSVRKPESELDKNVNLDIDKIDTALPYMFADEIKKITLKCKILIIDDLVDWFGNTFTVIKADNEFIWVDIDASPKAMQYWAMQYCELVEIIRPKKLRIKMAEMAANINTVYNNENNI